MYVGSLLILCASGKAHAILLAAPHAEGEEKA